MGKQPRSRRDEKIRNGAEAKFDVRVGNAYGPEARKALAMEIPRKFNRLLDILGSKTGMRRKVEGFSVS